MSAHKLIIRVRNVFSNIFTVHRALTLDWLLHTSTGLFGVFHIGLGIVYAIPKLYQPQVYWPELVSIPLFIPECYVAGFISTGIILIIASMRQILRKPFPLLIPSAAHMLAGAVMTGYAWATWYSAIMSIPHQPFVLPLFVTLFAVIHVFLSRAYIHWEA